jgi:hypothetical protein
MSASSTSFPLISSHQSSTSSPIARGFVVKAGGDNITSSKDGRGGRKGRHRNEVVGRNQYNKWRAPTPPLSICGCPSTPPTKTMQITLCNVGGHTGYVLDNALPSSYMSKLQCLRKSLPIDKEKKKTAAHRRFLCAENDLMWIRDGLALLFERACWKQKMHSMMAMMMIL